MWSRGRPRGSAHTACAAQMISSRWIVEMHCWACASGMRCPANATRMRGWVIV